MADVGNFDSIGEEVKETYPPGIFDGAWSTFAKYRNDLRRDTSYAKSAEGVVTFPLKLNGMWSVGITADNAAFPTPKDPVTRKGQLTPETFSFTIQVGLKTKHAAKSGKSTFHSGGVAGDRIEEAAEQLASYVNRVYVGSNRGRLANVSADGTSTFTCAAPLMSWLLEEGMRLEAYTAHTSGSVRDSFSNHKITAIDRDTHIVTYVGATDAADDRLLVAGDHIYITGSYARTPVSMPDIVDDGTDAATIFGETRATYPKLNASILDAGGALRKVTEQLILQAIDRPRRLVSKRITKAICNSGQSRKYVEEIAAARLYPGATTQDPRYKSGYVEGGLTIAAPGVNVALEEDLHCPPRRIYFLAFDTFFLYNAMDPDWLSDGPLGDLVPTDGGRKAGYIAEYGAIENQGCLMPRANSALFDLSDDLCGD